MSRDPDAGAMALVLRGLRRRCPRCTANPFDSYYKLADDCPNCGMHFEREDGYWLGALIINTLVTFSAFVAVFAGGIFVTWPDVPWVAIGAATVTVNLVLPILFYPISKTLWLGMEMSWHRLEPHEIELANSNTAARESG